MGYMSKEMMVQNPSFIHSLSPDPTGAMKTGKGDGIDPPQPLRAETRHIFSGVNGRKIEKEKEKEDRAGEG